MKKTNHIKAIVLLALALFTVNTYAGSKKVAPVEAEVIPIPEDISPWYLGAGIVAVKFHACKNRCDYEDITYGVILRGGYEINQYLGIETRGIRTFLDKGPFGGVPIQHIGLYLKPQYPVSEQINLYGLLGYGYTENLGNGARLNYFDSDHGLSAGIGLEYDLSDRDGDFLKNKNYHRSFDGFADQGKGWSLFVDYQRLLIKAGVPDMNIFAIGFRYDF